MLLLIKFAAKLFSIINSEESPTQIAAGVALGAWIGLIPIGLLPSLILFFCFLVNVNLAMLGLAAGIFKLIAFAVDPIANKVGYALLARTGALKPLWTSLYNMPVVPYTRFNNTIVLGSFVIGIVLIIPIYLLARTALNSYRQRYRDRIANSKFMKALKASTFYKYYETFRDLRGQ
jgi:uncharacterized protein (TIGR03546 family)